AAERVRDLGGAVAAGGPEWPGRLLAELALLRLLASALLRGDALPEGLRATARSRVGLPASPDASAPVRDSWEVLGRRAFRTGRLDGLRFWLRGRGSGRVAALVSFAPEGTAPDAPVRPGTVVDAELAFYPAEHRASLAAAGGARPAGPPAGSTAAGALDSWAAALAEDPWLEAWPVVLEDVRPARPREGGRWWLTDPAGDSLPLPAGADPPWRLAAPSGGAPVTVAGEWTPRGLHPLPACPPDGAPAPVPLPPPCADLAASLPSRPALRRQRRRGAEGRGPELRGGRPAGAVDTSGIDEEPGRGGPGRPRPNVPGARPHTRRPLSGPGRRDAAPRTPPPRKDLLCSEPNSRRRPPLPPVPTPPPRRLAAPAPPRNRTAGPPGFDRPLTGSRLPGRPPAAPRAVPAPAHRR